MTETQLDTRHPGGDAPSAIESGERAAKPGLAKGSPDTACWF